MDPITWLYIAAFVSGSYMQYDANRDAAKRTQRALQRTLERQRGKSDERVERVIQHAGENTDQESRNIRRDELQSENTQSILDAINTETDSFNRDYTGGRTSEESVASSARAKANTLRKLSQMAELQGRVRGTEDLDFSDTMAGLELESDIGHNRNIANIMRSSDDALTHIASIPDPNKQFWGGVLQQIGMMGAMNSMGTTGPSPTPGASTGAGVGAYPRAPTTHAPTPVVRNPWARFPRGYTPRRGII